MCVCLSVFFGALFLLSIHLQGSHPSICRLPGPPYHLSSSLLHSSHPSLLSHTSLSRSFPYPTSSLSPTHGPILGITIPRCRRRRKKKKNMRACALSVPSAAVCALDHFFHAFKCPKLVHLAVRTENF